MRTNIFLSIFLIFVLNLYDRIYLLFFVIYFVRIYAIVWIFCDVMKLQVNSTSELGEIIRATRKSHKIRLDDLAGMAGVGAVFAGDVEYGKETAQIGRIFKLLKELGLQLTIDVPEESGQYLQQIRKQNGLTRPSQRASKSLV